MGLTASNAYADGAEKPFDVNAAPEEIVDEEFTGQVRTFFSFYSSLFASLNISIFWLSAHISTGRTDTFAIFISLLRLFILFCVFVGGD